jgi:hypothetical protein
MSISEPNSAKPKFYTQEDIQEILQIAIARQTDESDEAFTKEQLLEIAMELGIDATDITQAEKTWVSQQNINQKQQEFQLYRRSKLQKKLTRFIIINSLFISTNLIFVGYVSWSLYIIAVWGINIAIATWKTYQTEGEEYQQELQKWQRDRDIKKSLNNIWARIQQAWQV